jgi:hypothetical protein
MKIKDLLFALVQKSEQIVRKRLEMQGLVFALAAKSAQANENKDVGILVPAKECASR